jgi:hypothetical protein
VVWRVKGDDARNPCRREGKTRCNTKFNLVRGFGVREGNNAGLHSNKVRKRSKKSGREQWKTRVGWLSLSLWGEEGDG